MILLLLFWWNPPVYGAAQADSLEQPVSLTGQDIVRIKPKSDITRKAFEANWGQFEVLIPKERFPVPAPHCRKNVILRMPAVAPGAPGREKELAFRWRTFRSLQDLIQKKAGHLDLFLAPGPYMSADQEGRPVLRYCNAYFSTKQSDR